MASQIDWQEFLVTLWRVGGQKFGLKLACTDHAMFIYAITGRSIEEMNQRCRTCRVKQILDQQLLLGDQVMCVNGKTAVSQILGELANFDVECCHMRVRRYPRKASDSNVYPVGFADTRAVPNLLGAGHPHLLTCDESVHQGLEMETVSGTSLLQVAKHVQFPGSSETASVISVHVTANSSARPRADVASLADQVTRPLLRMPHGIETRLQAGSPRVPAVLAGISADEQESLAHASCASDPGIVAAFASQRPSRIPVIMNYDALSEPEYGYLGVAEGTMVTVQPGSRSPPGAGNRFRCDYVFAWKMDQQESKGWLPVDILADLSVM